MVKNVGPSRLLDVVIPRSEKRLAQKLSATTAAAVLVSNKLFLRKRYEHLSEVPGLRSVYRSNDLCGIAAW